MMKKTMFDPRVNTIYVDMDGVLADFDAFVQYHMGRTFDHQSGPGDKAMWDFLKTVDDLYFNLPRTECAKELWDFCNSIGCPVKVLTAIPRRTSMPEAESQKRRWFLKHAHIFGDVDMLIGPYSADKWKHAKPGDILIDDRMDNITAWATKGGGVGVFHVNIKDTIALVQDSLP